MLTSSSYAALLAALLVLCSPAAAWPFGDYDPIVIPSDKAGAPTHLILFVPGGKVPPEDYAPFVRTAIKQSQTNVYGAIVHCGQLNLCNPLGELNGLLADAVKAASKAASVNFLPNMTFVVGHSLGGVGARHYVDVQGTASFAGLALLGTQYNGDHEDFKGTLGYPMDLKSFPIPLLALLGELDALPITHAASLVTQNMKLSSEEERAAKSVVVIPGMDHSQFCSPFNVSGDLIPEIGNDEATRTSGAVLAAWMDAVAAPSTSHGLSARADLLGWMQKWSAPILGAFMEAQALEESEWCIEAQKIILNKLPSSAVSSLDVQVLVRNGSASLEHGHTKYAYDAATKRLAITIVSYAYHAEVASWNPIDAFAPTYTGAKDISCKLLSADRIAEQLKLQGFYPRSKPDTGCDAINKAAEFKASALIFKHWPAAGSRFKTRGRGFEYLADSNTIAGPQWVFTTSLKFDDSNSSSVVVQSPALYSSIESKIYPGNHYCKVLSPAKAVEWMQTKGLKGRFK